MMKSLVPLWVCMVLGTGISSCGPSPKDAVQLPPVDSQPGRFSKSSPNCPTIGKLLPENGTVWVRPLDIWLAITADSTTFDPEYGESFRIAEVYDVKTCSLISRRVLPVNGSPDYPYYTAEISYHNTHQMVAIRGADSIFLFDAAARSWLPALKPGFITQRPETDSQSGDILRLEVWEDYIIGFCRDFGAFAFDLKERAKPWVVLPFAEFEASPTDYRSLFLIPSGVDTFQAIIPGFEEESGVFGVKPLLDDPTPLKLDTYRRSMQNPYLVLRKSGSQPTAVVIDFKKMQRINLPQDIAVQSDSEVLAWVSRNNR
jgi:hypothetical protein